MTNDELREEILRLGPWHHDVEIRDGIRTGEPVPAGTYAQELGTPSLLNPQRVLSSLVREVYPEGLGGRSFLDCACNAGGYLFAAKSLGASRGFGFDIREHWIQQARFLARHVSSEGIEFAVSDLSELRNLALEPFDVTFFSGIFYHLPDPVAGLRLAADHTRELLILNTAMTAAATDALILNRESDVEVMSGVHKLAWLPGSERVLREILEWCGFPHARVRFVRKTDSGRRRIELLAARDAKTFVAYDRNRREAEGGWVRRLLRR